MNCVKIRPVRQRTGEAFVWWCVTLLVNVPADTPDSSVRTSAAHAEGGSDECSPRMASTSSGLAL